MAATRRLTVLTGPRHYPTAFAFDAKGLVQRNGRSRLPTSFLQPLINVIAGRQGPREWDDVAMIAELRRLLEGHRSLNMPSL